MGSITRSHSFVSGEKPTESEWNVDIDQLFTLISGQIDTNNVDTTSSDGVSVLNANQTVSGTRSHSGALTMTNDVDLIFGTDSDIKIRYDETTDDALRIDTGVEGAPLAIVLKADQGDDAGDAWKVNLAASAGVLTFGNDLASKGTYVTQLTLTPHATVASSTTAIAGHTTIGGNATVTGVLKTDSGTDATNTTDGSLQTDGGLSVAKDAILGNDVKLLTDSSVLSLGVGSDATLTHDGTTGVTIAANPIIVDSGDALTLDAHTGIFVFKDAGTEVLRFTEGNSGDVTVKLAINGKDLVFTDNGDATNMKILDAAAGINVPGEVQTTKIAYTDGDDAITIADGGGVTTASTLTVGSVVNAGTDTNKFLVLDDSGNVDFRTGSELLSDIGAEASGSGDITSVVAGTGLTGGATSGAATVNVIGGDGITANANDVAITAAQTTITSIYATDLIIGEDSETAIDFGTADEIDFKINNTAELTLSATALYPIADAGLDLGTSALGYNDLHLGAAGIINFDNANMKITHSTAALTVAGGTLDVVGNAGVGIARTDGTLHVHTATAGSVAPNANEDDLVIENSTHCGITILAPDASDSTLCFGSASDAVGAILRWNHDANLLKLSTANAGDSITFGTAADVERMRITSGGNVGIGTASPDVGSNGANDVVVTISNSATAADHHAAILELNASTSANSAEIGKLAFTRSAATNKDHASIRALTASSDADAGADMAFLTKTLNSSIAERMRITSTGKVAMGTIGYFAPAAPLDIRDSAAGAWTTFIRQQSSGANYGLYISFPNSSNDNNTATFLECEEGGAARARIYSDGDVWTADAGTLTSDERLKTNIVDASDKLADVMRLQVRNFEWTPEYHPAKVGEKKIGFIAQELETVFPSLISEHEIAADNSIEEELYDAEDDIPEGKEVGDVKVAAKDHEPKIRKAYKDAFTPILVKALQEVTVRLEAAEAKITALESA